MPTMTPVLPPARQRLRDLMTATVADEVKSRTWTYHAVRPMPVPETWKPGQHVTGDCSKGVQFLCRWAIAPDPMRNNFGVYGNSSTIWAVLPRIDKAEVEVGDLVLFGPNGNDHAAMVYQADTDPMLWSFGHQGAPNFYRLSADTREKAFRKLMLDPLPGPDAKLKAETGYWAWLAWRLGEADWHGRGPKNPSVRPNVPAVIPATWWRDLARFLANRNKADRATT
jgi:hypothetical protein